MSGWAQDIARKLGKRVYDPRSLDRMLADTRAAADAYNRRNRGWDEPNRGGWGRSR